MRPHDSDTTRAKLPNPADSCAGFCSFSHLATSSSSSRSFVGSFGLCPSEVRLRVCVCVEWREDTKSSNKENNMIWKLFIIKFNLSERIKQERERESEYNTCHMKDVSNWHSFRND